MSARSAHLHAVCDEARARGESLFAAWTERVPARDPIALLAGEPGERFLLERPARERALVALGTCARVSTRGPDRFALAADRCEALFARVRAARAPGAGVAKSSLGEPKLVGGFAFGDEPPAGVWSGWPALSFDLPELAVERAGDVAFATVSVEVAPDAAALQIDDRVAALLARAARAPATERVSATGPLGFSAFADRTPEAYEAGISRALSAIARGELEKVVLARACELARRGGFAPASALARMRAQHPDCSVFAIARGDACFVGATPELLVERDGARLRASALAGSAPRGRTQAEDERAARMLLESKKEQEEHAIVRRALSDALRPLCSRLAAPEAPELLRLDAIQHLHTPFEGELRGGPESALLRLAARLHPTPATCGSPRDASRAFLAEHEQLERGWYAGGIGWLGSAGQGELAVALRCALLHGRRATLYAGAGVVNGSCPAAELAETSLKLRATLPTLVEL